MLNYLYLVSINSSNGYTFRDCLYTLYIDKKKLMLETCFEKKKKKRISCDSVIKYSESFLTDHVYKNTTYHKDNLFMTYNF